VGTAHRLGAPWPVCPIVPIDYLAAMLKPFLAAALSLCLLSSLASSARADDARRPNLIYILTDDQAAWSVGAYGNKDSQTKNQDRLAREGALFTNAFATTPVCSPSRAAILTGLYSTQVGITDWLTGPEQNVNALGVPDVPTWPAILKRNGYATALFGKWHLGTKPQFHPTKRGYDVYFGSEAEDDEAPAAKGNKASRRPTADLLTDRALDFIRAKKDAPFAVSIHYREPHLPYRPVPQQDAAPFADLDPTIPDVRGNDAAQIKNWTRDYYAAIHSVDRNLGRLLDELDKLSLSNRTVVVYTSDHGYNIGHHNLHTKGNGNWVAGGVGGPKRPNMFDTSLRVPLLVRWPGTVHPGTRIEYMASLIDTFPTMLAIAGVSIPDGVRQHGLNLLPLLHRAEPSIWRDAVYGQYDLHNSGLAYMRMIRTDRYKLVRHHFANGLNELYDLHADPGELKNLWNHKPLRSTRDDLQSKLDAWEKSIQDPILTDPRRSVEADGPPGEG
jgi:uncharacterized sulfatase